MSLFEEQLETYLHEELDSITKENCYSELLNKYPDYFSEEQELSNMIELSFSTLNVKESVIGEINKSGQKPFSDFALNVVEELKQKETQKNDTIKFIIFAAAALITLSVVFMGTLQDDSMNIVTHTPETPSKVHEESNQLKKEFPQIAAKPEVISAKNVVKTSIDKGDTVRGKGVLQLPQGVKVFSYEQAQYSFDATEHSFLKMKRGKALVDVKSRKGKSPLYFNLPHGQVEVTGTQFELVAGLSTSSVEVTEGTVNYLARNEQISVSAGQTGISSKSFLKASYNLHDTLLHYSFDNPASAPNGLNKPRFIYGASGNALQFDEQTSIQLKSLAPSPTRSLSFWINANELIEAERTILTLIEGDKKLQIYMKGENIVMLTQVDKGQPRKISFRIRYGWHHIVLNQSNNQYEFFLNDANIKKGALPSFYEPQISLGDSYQSFNGKIDELRVLNRKLSRSEISQLKNEREMSLPLK